MEALSRPHRNYIGTFYGERFRDVFDFYWFVNQKYSEFFNVVFTNFFPDLSNHFTIKMAQGDQQQFCLRWNDFQTNMVSSFKHLRDEKSFTDVTLACDGQTCKAHKMVLSACSPYFKVCKIVKNAFFSQW